MKTVIKSFTITLFSLLAVLPVKAVQFSVDLSAASAISDDAFHAGTKSVVVTEKDQHELYQRNAPQVEAALYLVPKVIE